MPLDLSSFPLYLFQASQERAWTVAEIDYSREGDHWASLNDDERTLLGRLIAGFRVGERGVTHELAPLLSVVRDEKRLDEELFITAQLFEEARHVEYFERWLQAALPTRVASGRSRRHIGGRVDLRPIGWQPPPWFS